MKDKKTKKYMVNTINNTNKTEVFTKTPSSPTLTSVLPITKKRVKKGENNGWSSVSKKGEKIYYLDLFTFDMKEEYNLSWNETRELNFLLYDALFLSKTQSSKDVIFSNKIIEINGIYYDNNKKKFINNYAKNIKNEDESIGKNYLYYHFDTYVATTLKKKSSNLI
jgi:hypothetical protein